MTPRLTDLIGLEFFKIRHKKESYLLFGLCLIPLLYGWGFFTNNPSFIYRGSSLVSFLDWLQLMTMSGYVAFIFNVFVAIIASRAMGGEIDDHSVLLYVPRINSRAKTYLAKAAAVTLFITAAYAVFIAVCTVVYYTVMVRVPTVANGEFAHQYDSLGAVLYAIAIWGTFVLVGFMTLALSLYLKPLLCIAVTTIGLLALQMVSQIAPFAYASPWFYVVRVFDLVSGATADTAAGNIRLELFTTSSTTTALLLLAVGLVWAVAFHVAGTLKYRTQDL